MQAVLHPIIGPRKELHDLAGRTAVITGGAEGIGGEVAKAFASVGCRVIMVNRKEEQGDAMIAKIKEETPDANVEWIGCDLGTLSNVKEVFDGIAKKLDRLDLLILSAGINTNFYGLDNDGIDRHFGVNHLGHFLVINALWPLLTKTAETTDSPPRIVFESSEMHRGAPSAVQFKTLEEINNDKLGPTELYGRTKLAMILTTKYLVKNIIQPKDSIYAIAVHPGVVGTKMQDQWETAYGGLTGKLLKNLNYLAARSPEQGSYSALYAATSPEVLEKNYNGVYMQDVAKVGGETEQAQDMDLAANLWTLSTKIIEDKLGKDALHSWTS